MLLIFFFSPSRVFCLLFRHEARGEDAARRYLLVLRAECYLPVTCPRGSEAYGASRRGSDGDSIVRAA